MNDSIQYEEINLGKYIETLFRQWRLIVIAVVICAAAATLITLMMPRQYAASALVATRRTTSNVSFGSTITTLSEDDLLAEGSSQVFNIDARLRTYTQMVDSPDIARVVLDQLGDRIPPEKQNDYDLLEAVEASIAEGSDAIRIKVTYSDPVLAAEIANAWAEEYVQKLNQVFTGSGRKELLQEVSDQVMDAKTAYDQAQSDLEAFVAENQIASIQRQIDYLNLRITSLVSTRESVLNQRTEKNTRDLADSYQKLQELELLIANTRALKQQIEEGGDNAAASSSLALLLLKYSAYVPELTISLDIQPESLPANRDQTLLDLESLIESLLDLKDQTEEHITALEETMLAEETQRVDDEPLVELISDLEGQVTELEARKNQEQALWNELSRARDLTWQTYDNLVTKLEELKVETQTANALVSVASRAVVPREDTVSGSRNVAYAGLVGLVLGIGAAYFTEFWWSYNDRELLPITIRSFFRSRGDE